MSPRKIKRRLWREDEKKLTSPKDKQPGVSPDTFHKFANDEESDKDKNLEKILNKTRYDVLREERKKVTIQIKLKRAAYKELTSLKTWPLQDLALKNLDHLQKAYLGDYINSCEKLNEDDVETHGDSTGLSSSSLDEPKRLKRKDSDDEENLSPRKATLRNQFKRHFCKEQELNPFIEIDHPDLQPALWCMEPRIFAIEKSKTGKRKYIVGNLGRFLDYYWRKSDPKQRHFYELIREKTPCRLFFDLEFSKEANPSISEEESQRLIEDFVEELILEFKRIYSIDITGKNVIDLDSSTEKKFSRHLVIHMPDGELFADAAAAGRFVRVFVGRLAEEAATGKIERRALKKYLFVNPAPSKAKKNELPENENEKLRSQTCFVDLAVYTRNRLFRIMGSSKFGKPASASLRIAGSNQFLFPEGFSNKCFYTPLAKDLAEMGGKNEKEIDGDISSFKAAVDWTNHAEALAATLVVPMNVTKCKFKILEDSKDAKIFIGQAKTLLGRRSSATRRYNPFIPSERSPFLGLETFVLNNLANRGGVKGGIRAWNVEHAGKTLKSITYQISHNHWCECIGRAHKSNNIMWTIDFIKMEATQTCWDPECRGFRGTPVSIPEDLIEEIQEILFEQEIASLDENNLIEKMNDSESKSEFDDEEFEKALMSLKIDGEVTPMKSNQH